MSERFRNNKGDLIIGNVNAASLVDEFRTPLYAYCGEGILNNFKNFSKSLGSLNFNIYYSVKANSSMAILSLLAKEGAGADIVSVGEMHRALRAGILPSKIVFSGVGKTDEELREAIKNKIGQINIESCFELNKIVQLSENLNKKVNVAIRVNIDIDAKTHKKIATGKEDTKFGISIKNNDAENLYKKISIHKNLIPSGLAIHIGSQINDISLFKKAYLSIFQFAEYLKGKGLNVPNLDLGGGLGIDYKNLNDPNFIEYGKLVKDIFSGKDFKLGFEPGRCISANNGILLTKVIGIKITNKKRFIIVDSAMNDLIRPTLYNSFHLVEKISKKNEPLSAADIVGPICETGDFFAENRMMPDVKEGDTLAIFSVGAYGASMMSNYNTRPEAAEVIIFDNKPFLIRARKSIDELLSYEVNPFE